MALKNICLVICERHGTDELQIDNGQFIDYHDLFSIIPHTLCVCVFCHQFSLFNWIEMNWNVSSTKCLLGQLCCSLYFIIAIYAMFDVRHFIVLSNYNSLLLSHRLDLFHCVLLCTELNMCVYTSFEITCDSLLYLYC